jgi:hypothetical protein
MTRKCCKRWLGAVMEGSLSWEAHSKIEERPQVNASVSRGGSTEFICQPPSTKFSSSARLAMDIRLASGMGRPDVRVISKDGHCSS